MQKTKLKSYLGLLAPSSLGIVFYVFLSALGVVLNQFSAIQKVLELPHDLGIVSSLARSLDRILTAAIGETHTQTLVVGLFWAGVGLFVYVLLRGLSKMAVELDDDIDERRYVWPKGTNRYKPLQIFMEKALLQVVSLAGLIIVLIGPLATVISRPVLVDIFGANKSLLYLVWFIAGILTWHLMVILLRLVTLRARLFD